MSALATHRCRFSVTWLRTSPATAVTPPITRAPATTTVVGAGSVLRRR